MCTGPSVLSEHLLGDRRGGPQLISSCRKDRPGSTEASHVAELFPATWLNCSRSRAEAVCLKHPEPEDPVPQFQAFWPFSSSEAQGQVPFPTCVLGRRLLAQSQQGRLGPFPPRQETCPGLHDEAETPLPSSKAGTRWLLSFYGKWRSQ